MLSLSTRIHQLQAFQQMRRGLVTAASRKKKAFVKPYQSPDSLLQDPEIQSILHNSEITADMPLTRTNTKIAILSHFSAAYDEPVPSNVLERMNSASEIAAWYSERLKPVGAVPHTRRIILTTLTGTSTDEKDEKVELDQRIDLDRGTVQEEFLSSMPSNLQFDERTFRDATPVGIREKRTRPKVFGRKEKS